MASHRPTVRDGKGIEEYRDPAWAPNRYCPRCTTRRHRTWYAVGRCRFRHGLLWVAGNPPADGPCFATVSYCGHPYPLGRAVTVILWRTLADAQEALAGFDREAP